MAIDKNLLKVGAEHIEEKNAELGQAETVKKETKKTKTCTRASLRISMFDEKEMRDWLKAHDSNFNYFLQAASIEMRKLVERGEYKLDTVGLGKV